MSAHRSIPISAPRADLRSVALRNAPAGAESASLTAPFAQGSLVLGITGGTGCGKTTLLNIIRDHGGLVLDCDAIYHQLLTTDPALLASIEARFPGTVENGTLRRKKLGAIVFSDPPALQDLNAITHAAIKAEVLRRLETAPALAAIDAIALFEGNLSQFCNITVAVTAPFAERVQRLQKRDNISEEYAKNRIAAQHDEDWFRDRCDCILENNGTSMQFYNKCIAFLSDLGIIKE